MNIFYSELIGTFILLTAVLLSHNTVFIAVAFLGAILIAAYSGSHLNPVVTMVMAIKGVVDKSKVYVYIAGQIIGALLALFVSNHVKL